MHFPLIHLFGHPFSGSVFSVGPLQFRRQAFPVAGPPMWNAVSLPIPSLITEDFSSDVAIPYV